VFRVERIVNAYIHNARLQASGLLSRWRSTKSGAPQAGDPGSPNDRSRIL
jgi:hypothetical protein